jgi:hypothetical protein
LCTKRKHTDTRTHTCHTHVGMCACIATVSVKQKCKCNTTLGNLCSYKKPGHNTHTHTYIDTHIHTHTHTRTCTQHLCLERQITKEQWQYCKNTREGHAAMFITSKEWNGTERKRPTVQLTVRLASSLHFSSIRDVVPGTTSRATLSKLLHPPSPIFLSYPRKPTAHG